MTIATGRPTGRRRKLTVEQHQMIADRTLTYMRLRLEAAKHSQAQLARELGVCRETVRDYIDRKIL